MRFLYFTDTHIRGNNPQNRKDNFYDSLQRKIREVFELARQLKVDVILHGGDIFDRPDISPSLVREFALLIHDYNFPIYAVAGNHDIFGQNLSTLHRTMLGLLDGIGLIKIIPSGGCFILQDEHSGAKIQLTGQGYFYGIDDGNHMSSYIIKKSADVDYALHMVHGMLLEKPFYEGVSCTLLKDILDTQADITLSGHYHTGFGIQRIQEKYFVNPGSIARINNSVSEISRKPKVCLIEINKNIEIKELELESALSGLEVFDRSKVEALAFREKKLSQFINSFLYASSYNTIDIHKIIEEIRKRQNTDETVVHEALMRIDKAEETLREDGLSR